MTELTQTQIEQLACTYAALILHDDGLDITDDNIAKLTEAANVTVNPYFPKLWADCLQNRQSKLDELITGKGGSVIGGGAGGATGGAATGGADAGGDGAADAGKEEKKEEAEDAEEGMGGLFGGGSDDSDDAMGGLFGGSDSED